MSINVFLAANLCFRFVCLQCVSDDLFTSDKLSLICRWTITCCLFLFIFDSDRLHHTAISNSCTADFSLDVVLVFLTWDPCLSRSILSNGYSATKNDSLNGKQYNYDIPPTRIRGDLPFDWFRESIYCEQQSIFCYSFNKNETLRRAFPALAIIIPAA